jgi:hypothetical protein
VAIDALVRVCGHGDVDVLGKEGPETLHPPGSPVLTLVHDQRVGLWKWRFVRLSARPNCTGLFDE